MNLIMCVHVIVIHLEAMFWNIFLIYMIWLCSLFFLSFICGWTHMRDKAINRTVHCEKWFIYGETYFLDTVILFNVYMPVRM